MNSTAYNDCFSESQCGNQVRGSATETSIAAYTQVAASWNLACSLKSKRQETIQQMETKVWIKTEKATWNITQAQWAHCEHHNSIISIPHRLAILGAAQQETCHIQYKWRYIAHKTKYHKSI